LNLPDCGHHASHPIVKIALPVIEVDKYVFAGLKWIYTQLVAGDDSESSSGSSRMTATFSHPHKKLTSITTVGSGDDEVSDAEEDANSVRGKLGDDESPTPRTTDDASATPRTTDAPKNSPFYKPWSFSEVEALLQNNVPWGELPRGIEVETPTEIDHPQWRSAATSNIGAHEHGATVTRSQEPLRGYSTAMYRCLRCKRYNVGVRFVITKEHRGMRLVFVFHSPCCS